MNNNIEEMKITSNKYNNIINNVDVIQKEIIPNKKTICFATMCKNEAHCIRETLESVYKYIDTWVVHDTGSTDETCKIVEDFFKEKNIPGELFVGEWVGFDYNKTLLFERCYGKSDYILHLDADDIFHGEPDFSLLQNHDAYYFNCYRGSYYNVLLLFNNHNHWKFCGVAHTIIKNLDKAEYVTSTIFVSNDYYLLSRDTGSRSNDPEKYYKDALKLKDQFFNTLFDDIDGLNRRSAFYTAQSYHDSQHYTEALQWYSLYINLTNTWNEEVFESHYRIASILIRINGDFIRIKHEIDTCIRIFSDRIEPYYLFGKYCNQIKKYDMGYEYLIKTVDIDYQDIKNKYTLFINHNMYYPNNIDELSVSCYWTKRYKEGYNYIQSIKNCPQLQADIERIHLNEKHFVKQLDCHTNI